MIICCFTIIHALPTNNFTGTASTYPEPENKLEFMKLELYTEGYPNPPVSWPYPPVWPLNFLLLFVPQYKNLHEVKLIKLCYACLHNNCFCFLYCVAFNFLVLNICFFFLSWWWSKLYRALLLSFQDMHLLIQNRRTN